MQKVQKPINPKCNIALSAPCQNYSINCLLGWADELHTLWKPYQEVEMWLTELQNKYRVAKKTACWYKLWEDGKEIHIQQEWQRILVGLQNVLLVVQGKAQAALTLFTIMCFFYSTVTCFDVCISSFGGKQWQATPKNLPRMQRTRAITVAWLSSGLCPDRPKGWIPIIIISSLGSLWLLKLRTDKMKMVKQLVVTVNW